MSDFRTRLVLEEYELSEKIDKLSTFLDSDESNGIADQQKTLLKIQLPAMVTYRDCLKARLEIID